MAIFEEIKKRVIKRHEIENLILESIPVGLISPLGSVGDSNVYFDSSYYADILKDLHTLREALGNYELKRYYASWCGLALSYKFEVDGETVHYVFFAKDKERALEKVSNGKCHFETVTEPELLTTREKVVCDL